MFSFEFEQSWYIRRDEVAKWSCILCFVTNCITLTCSNAIHYCYLRWYIMVYQKAWRHTFRYNLQSLLVDKGICHANSVSRSDVHIHHCRKLDVQGVMGVYLFVIFCLITRHTLSYVAWCTGEYLHLKSYEVLPSCFIRLSERDTSLSLFIFFSDGVDENTVGRLLSQLFSDGLGTLGKINSLLRGSASRKFDMKEEVKFLLIVSLFPTC